MKYNTVYVTETIYIDISLEDSVAFDLTPILEFNNVCLGMF